MNIQEYSSNKKKIIDVALDKYLPSPNTKPGVIHRAMRYAVFSGAKRIRPVLTIASFEACRGKGNLIMPVSCAIELIHTYTIIHDDLPCMDNDDTRRGKPSCHKKFSEDIALLAGDALLTLAFQVLSEAGNVEVIKEISKAIGSCGTIGGQVVDILKEKPATEGSPAKSRAERGEPRRGETTPRLHSGQGVQKPDKGMERISFDYIASHKTGALFEAAVKAGAMIGLARRVEIDALSNFGRDIGWTFQLVDDLIDNDGYVKLYGSSFTRKKAEFLTKKAKDHLKIFGKRAKRLLEMADLILYRRY